VRAIGLSGVDGRLLLARRKVGARAVVGDRVVRLADDRSGAVEQVDAALLHSLLDIGVVPVIGPPAITADGEIVNVDADRAASSVAVALRAEALVLLTNVPGLLARPDDPTSRVARIPVAEVDQYLPLAHGRMRKKLLAAREAVDAGVSRAVIAPSNVPAPVEHALRGGGTVIA
jgi:acetylglutamate/LysW-gamma-L-alpha-aminoadipate kinase